MQNAERKRSVFVLHSAFIVLHFPHPMDRIETKLKTAIAHHEAGRIVDAHRLYKQVLAELPDEPDALHLLGLLYAQSGNAKDAIGLLRRAIANRPKVAQFHLTLAQACRAEKQFEEAVGEYRSAMELNPFAKPMVLREFAELLAVLGRPGEAIPYLEKAVEQEPTAQSIGLLGELLISAGRAAEAVERLRSAVALQPMMAEVHGALGAALEKSADYDGAEASYRRAIELKPDLAEAHNNLGHLLVLRRQLAAAVTHLIRAIEIRPVFPQAHNNLALAYTGLSQADDALASYRKALEQERNFPEAWEGLGRVLMDLREYDQAVTAFHAFATLRPTSSAYLLLANACGGRENLDGAIESARQAVRLAPDSADAHEALATELQYTGDLEPALMGFRRALELNPQQHSAHSKLVYALLTSDHNSPGQILAEHVQWAAQQTGSIVPIRRPRNQRSPDRRLRVGYISPNFRNQAVAAFVLPIFQHHDKSAVEVYAYSDVAVPDAKTEIFKSLADRWFDTTAMSDEQLARKIREDRIDILVELTGHIGKGRLRALAYKPAPVQVSYIGYQGTTGVAAVDYVMTDDWADPPGAERNYVEKPFRLPGSFFVYDPPLDAPLVSPLPSRRMEYITFGCMNAINKVTAKTVALWAKIMSAVPGSRLMLLTTRCWKTNDRITTGFAAAGIGDTRIQFVYRTGSIDYFRRYSHIDIALDPVPMNGHTTTCDAAWMGVPTVTLSGEIYAHRYGGSVLRNLGLPELVTETDQAYVAAAIALANDPARLAHIRSTLRHTMQMSPITDGPAFTRNLEQAYRQMWHGWLSTAAD
jgi:protein O-GlcNAc transferase